MEEMTTIATHMTRTTSVILYRCSRNQNESAVWFLESPWRTEKETDQQEVETGLGSRRAGLSENAVPRVYQAPFHR